MGTLKDSGYEQMDKKISDILTQITPYAESEHMDDLEQIRQNFRMKVGDFHREGRKLNIGVIGRVKAGKSSFLNTLLFDGEEVLPKAATPKTATLTKMEYADKNRIVIEFYSPEEWERIVEDAKQGDKNEITKSAKELVDMAQQRGLNVDKILSEGQLDKSFEEYQELVSFLNNYVGENGQYTPLVRSVVIYMNREEFREVSIVDTPGLNDPIPSRTQRTKEFIEVCDVVFFLSRAGSFLDMNDWELLCKQLPQKGVKKLVLVASQYDSGLRDVLVKEEKSNPFQRKGKESAWKRGGSVSKATKLTDAKALVAKSLQSRVREKIASFEAEKGFGSHDMILKILKECETPILISSRAQDMARKAVSEYSREEREDLEYWKYFIPEKDQKKAFLEMGNFEEIRKIYESVKEEKKKILEEKEQEFIPKVRLELSQHLEDLTKQMQVRLEYLQSNDKESLEKKQHLFESKINSVKADIVEIFGDTIAKIKAERQEVNQVLRNMSVTASKLETHTGTETHSGVHTSYKFHLGPIKLGRQDSHYSYTTTYTYLAASDALEQINAYGKGAANEIEQVFREVVEFKAYRRQLLQAVIKNFDSSENDFDSNYFRIVVQNALNHIEFPVVEIDVSKELDAISNQFSGEVRNGSDQEKFRALLSKTVEKMYQSLLKKVESTIEEFQSAMMQIQQNLCQDILEKSLKEFESVKAAMAHKEQEIQNDETYIQILKKLTNEL